MYICIYIYIYIYIYSFSLLFLFPLSDLDVSGRALLYVSLVNVLY